MGTGKAEDMCSAHFEGLLSGERLLNQIDKGSKV